MARGWRDGKAPHVEDYLRCHPELRQSPAAVLELLSEELTLRQEQGQDLDPAEVLERFPQWPSQVSALLECHQVLAAGLTPIRFPETGELLGEFHLLAELGRGSHARVFLARQRELADRLVVLKVGPRTGSEHLSLARLQHTHIVPLYSVHDFPRQGVRALCLPYFGGGTLDRLLEHVRDLSPGERKGQDLLNALRRLQHDGPGNLPVAGPACRFLARASYVQAVCWLGGCLADALQYAQERGLAHLDLKPSNVLLAADAQPMLLDFHLARGPIPAGAAAPAWLGGTPGYMPPEQQAALAAVVSGAPLPAGIDGRADVYSLGVLLCELLGANPSSDNGDLVNAVGKINPAVTPGLRAVLRRCLAADPSERYATAADLAEDLRRHLADLPLRGVPNRSLLERWAKWRRRRPHALPLVVLLVLAAAVGGVLVTHLPSAGRLQRQTEMHQPQVDRAGAAAELHRFCDRIRALDATDPLPPGEARAVAEQCRRLWKKRQDIVRSLVDTGNTDLETQVRDDLLDLAILWTRLLMHTENDSSLRAAHTMALLILVQAEELLGPSRELYRERAAHAVALGIRDADRKAGLSRPLRPAGSD